MQQLLLIALLLAGGTTGASAATKEFADCGSTSLVPLKLELDPDPAEVPSPTALRPLLVSVALTLQPQASKPLEFIVTMEASKMVTGGNLHATITSTR